MQLNQRLGDEPGDKPMLASTRPIDRLLRVLQHATACDATACWLLQEGRLQPAAAAGAPLAALGGIILPDPAKLSSGGAFAGDVVLSPDRTLAWYGIPVLRNGALLGALACVSQRPRSWSAQDQGILTDLAESLADQLELTGGAARDLDARPRADTRYRDLFERSRDAIYMTQRDGRLIDVNIAMLDLFGYTREELLQLNASDLYHDQAERDRFLKQIDRVGSVREHELQMRRKDGTIVVCLKTATVQRTSDGVVVGYQSILHDITERKRTENELERSAFHDPLTGLPNRSLLHDRLERLQRYARRHLDYRFALMFLDLDNFKLINDTHGHLVGDELLIAVARRLEGALRQEDTVARLGGDEFAVIVDAIEDAHHATRVAERILQELAMPIAIDNLEIPTGTSIGIAVSLTGYDDIESMIRDADAAMYRAKTAGRGRFEIFDTEMHASAANQLQLESDLSKAVHYDEFTLHYLPIFAIKDRKLAGLEALVRWNHPKRGLLHPGDFMQVAEDSGTSVPLGWWVLRQACVQLRDWQAQFGAAAAHLSVCVNLSGRQFLQPDLIRQVDIILRDTGIPHGSLRLEVAESVLMRNADAAVHVLRELDLRGVRINVDDFGTGYSSLSYLQRFPLNAIKIDRSFVGTLSDPDAASGRLVKSMIALGQSMNIPAVGEGVETEEQLRVLDQLGVQYVQGFLLSAPLDADGVTGLINRI
jgi:diguanylate cyclase (GGDEF)-like protein/PAS domain S-box-containing protein